MSKKILSIGMIIPLAAAGAVATAPSASATPGYHHHFDRVSCSLDADALRHMDKIKIEFKLNGRQNSQWKVKIEQNGRPIVSTWYLRTHHGFLKVVTLAKDKRGTDEFKATATNRFTGQKCVARDRVKEVHRHR